MCAKKHKKIKKRGERIYIPYAKEEKGPSWVTIGILCLLQLYPIALFLIALKMHAKWKNKKVIDYRNYAAIIGDRCEVDIHELSAKLGKTPSLVKNDLQVMIDKGYLGSDAYIDRSRGVLVVDATVTEFVEDDEDINVPFNAEEVKEEILRAAKIVKDEVRKSGVTDSIKAEFRRAFDTDAVRAKEEEEQQPQEEATEKSEPVRQPDAFSREDDFEAKLREIRNLNDEIDDEGVSNRIDRIGELTASIFTVVRRKPERADEVKKFMNYYLPTTFKLLKSYALMEKQSYQGENIVASRKKIEDILDSLITAFEQQQDRLFRTEALDVEADIQVLETMMAKDGLVTPKGLDMRSMGGK